MQALSRLRHLPLILLFSLLFVSVNAQSPTHSISSFTNLPARLFFFDDTTSAIYHDVIEGDVYVSSDEGKSWQLAPGVPRGEAIMVVEHPFNNQYAFIITKTSTHYRTSNRGGSFRAFTMPVPIAMSTGKPLSFHSDPKKFGWILYQGVVCERKGWSRECHDETYYTLDAFADAPRLLLSDTSRCLFAHSSPDFKHSAPESLIYCIAFTSTSSSRLLGHDISSSRLFSSTDFFETDNTVELLGIGDKNARGVVAFAIVSKFAVVALRDVHSNRGEMLLYVTVDTKTWAQGQFPHASSASLRENAYTIVESSTHSLGVDVVLQDQGTIGTLFLSNSNGTFFSESLTNTNRNEYGFVDFENVYGVDGVGMANVVSNADAVLGQGSPKQIQTAITFDDGRTWSNIPAPSTDVDGERISCDGGKCNLHFHSVTTPHKFGRVFSSPAPGFVMAVGSVGETLAPYEESDTWLSTDAGVSWKMVRQEPHKYEFGDSGSLMVVVNDEEGVDVVRYSMDEGENWNTYSFGVKLRARALLTIPDSTSQKFLLLGQVARKDQTKDIGRFVVVFLDFAPMRKRKCTDRDFEKWYARSGKGSECLMGHKQWYRRRKAGADCYVGEKFSDPVEHEDNCSCTDADYECDYNYIRSDDKCIPAGPEPIPAGVCRAGAADQTYMGSSGYRKIPGNTCVGGVKKDEQVKKDCSQAKPEEGAVTHQTFEFPAHVEQHAYFKQSTTILVRLSDNSVWQSGNEGYTWEHIQPSETFLGFYHHPYSNDRAYLLTPTNKYYYTTDAGRHWLPAGAPHPPNSFRVQVLHFHPNTDWLIWAGNEDCEAGGSGREDKCHVKTSYTLNHGRGWYDVDSYVRTCTWARDGNGQGLQVMDNKMIICESYRDKKGAQRAFGERNPRELVVGGNYYHKRQRQRLFEHVVGFTKFSEFLLVAELHPERNTLALQVSLDAQTFATGMFPPSMHPESHAYTVLESSTKAVFLHMTMTEARNPPWGSILKSNSNGTYFGLSIENVNRDDRGLVDFEKMIGLDGIALINTVVNTDEATVTGKKRLQTKITHNDGSTWKALTPPLKDMNGNEYECNTVDCALHVHGYTERYDPRATYSSPSVVGLIMAVGNVGRSLAPYTLSDTFLSRDGGFTWQEVHKDAHLWEFGDSGSILVMANDEEPTDRVVFSTDEGMTWREYVFGPKGGKRVRVRSIVTVPEDNSRRFILIGTYEGDETRSVVVHLDFTSLTWKECVLNVQEGATDDFELWSPSEERAERCLFGRQTLYHRRIRDADCVVGKQEKAAARIVKNCECMKTDFECEFNYIKNEDDECVLVPGTTPLPSDDHVCLANNAEVWYDRTPYRKIAFSTCEGGYRPDLGAAHQCPGLSGHGWFFWFIMFVLAAGITALLAWWWNNHQNGGGRGFRSGGGNIRLPGAGGPAYGGSTSFSSTLASVPYFLLGVGSVAWEWVTSTIESSSLFGYREPRGYRNIPVDEDAQILRFEDEEEE